jgi:hypothetical protein
MRRESEEKRIAREQLYQSYKESGLSMSAYSRERGVPFWQVRGAVKKSEAVTENLFREVVLPAATRSLEYTAVLRSGRELRIPGGFSAEQVSTLVEILER